MSEFVVEPARRDLSLEQTESKVRLVGRRKRQELSARRGLILSLTARRALSLLVTLTLGMACRPTASDVPPSAEQPSVGVRENPKAPALAVDCGAPIDGAGAVLRAGALIMLGELHGTRQIPAFAGDLACTAAIRGLRVRVGLELPRSQDQALATYLAGSGGAAEREALLGAEHWQRVDQDGRGSVAMLALIDRVRMLSKAGLDVELFAFDEEASAESVWNERDRSMATRILERAAGERQAVVLTLSGNLHNRTVQGLPWDANAVPMGVHVLRARPDALSLDGHYQGGTAWICQPACGMTKLAGRPGAVGRRIVLHEEPDEHGRHGSFSVGPIEASPPAAAPPSQRSPLDQND